MENQNIKASLRDYFRVLCYWKGTVVSVFLIVALTALLVSFILPPIYEAFTLILVEREPRPPVTHKDYGGAAVPYQLSVAEGMAELANTQSEIITSRHILEKVALEFGLDNEFEEPNRLEQAAAELQNRVKIKVRKETSIIELRVQDKDPELSARLANAIAENYVNWVSETKQSKTKDVSWVLDNRISSLHNELETTEEKLSELKKKGDVSALQEELKTTVTKLADFNAQCQLILADIEEKETRFRELNSGLKLEEDLLTVSQDIASPVVDALKLKLLDLQLRKTSLLGKYRKDSLPLESIEDEISQTKAKLSREIQNAVNSMEIDLAALRARKQSLEHTAANYKKRLDQLSVIETEYQRLEREVKGKNELYMTLLGKRAEAALAETVKSDLLVNVKIVDPAKVPLVPKRPKKALNTALGCIVGFISGIGGAFLKEYWDHTIKTVDGVKRHLELPCLATVARARTKGFTLYAPGSPIAESFHTLSVAVQQLCKENGINTLLVASANRGEGKSVVCANLAMSLASIKDKRVLVVEGNLRQPALHRFFEVKIKSDLVTALSSGRAIKTDPTDIKNLSLVSTMEEISEPSRLFATDSMRSFIKKAKTEYDYVIFDSPALISYPDAAMLGFELDGIILVVNFGQTKREAVERAMAILDKSRRKIMGAVLNNVEHVIPERLYRHL